MTLSFFDANTWIGRPACGGRRPPENAASLLAAMDRAGIARAVVWHIAQAELDPQTGNDLLARDIAPHDRLIGAWMLLPTQCGELGDLAGWLARAASARVRVFRVQPAAARFLLRAVAFGDVLAALQERRLPLMLPIRRGLAWDAVYSLLSDFPHLTVILSDLDIWPSDRFFRPLIEQYPRVYVEISTYLADGGIEAFVSRYGSERMLFGSGYPECYHGSAMLQLAHAEIADADKSAIASGNLERLLAESRS